MEHKHHSSTGVADAGPLAKDPVCGMSVDPATAKHKAEHAGAIYYFCSGGCREKFVADPVRFLAQPAHAPAAHAHGHAHYASAAPSPKPGGRDLHLPDASRRSGRTIPEAARSAAWRSSRKRPRRATGPSEELADMTRRFWIALALSIPVFALAMGGHLVDLHRFLPEALSNWIELALATPVALWAGWPFFERAFASLKTRNLNMFTLIAMGVGVAWAYSVVATVAPGLFPSAFRTAHGAVAVYFEAAAVITTLVLLGQVLELRAREQTGGAIRALLDLAPKTARLVRTGRRGPGGRTRCGEDRRPAARPAGREGPGGRRGHRGAERGR